MNNSELTPLNFLIGTWNVEMKHTALSEPLQWQDSFEWLEDSFILWHFQGKNEVPKATLIIGCNENKSENKYTMLYHDIRGVSRTMEMSFENEVWKYWRLNQEFSQRFDGIVSNDGKVIEGKGEASKDGGKTWEHDYSIVYRMIE